MYTFGGSAISPEGRLQAPVRFAVLLVTLATSKVAVAQDVVDSTWRPAPSRGVAELPRVYAQVPRELLSKECTRSVKAGANLQDAIDRARGGDVICLSAGASYEGSFVLRRRSDTSWVVIRTEVAAGEAPSVGERVRPSHAANLARIVARSADQSALRTAPGARRWYLALLEITTDSMAPQGPTALITFGGPGGPAGGARDGAGGDEGRAAARDALIARELVLDRVYAHGWPQQTLRRCLALNSGAAALVDSWLDECHEKGADSQAIAGWGGPGPFHIENNTLAGAGENIMFGGADPRTPGLTPSDIVIRRNHIVTPVEWKGRWSKKNILETKNVRRLLVEENVMDGSWADGQDGWAVVLKSANQSGGCTWCGTADVIIRRNLVRNVGAGFSVYGRGGDRPNIDSLSRRIEVTENYVERVGAPPYRGVGRLFIFLTGAEGVVVSNNTVLAPPSADLSASIVLGSRNVVSARGFVFERNVLTRGRYAVSGCGGPKTILECLPGARISGNFLIGPSRPEDRFLAGFLPASSEGTAGRAGMARVTIERYTAGVVVAP